MNINELIGYKNHPIYQKARNLYDPNAISKAGDRYDSNRNKRINQGLKFEKFLDDHGFKKLSSGSFGFVYEKPGYPWVFKIFTQDPAYLHFLKYALANQSNPNLPKLKGKILKINDNTYAVRMEKLQSTRSAEITPTLIELFQIIENIHYRTRKNKDTNWLKNNYPGIYKIINDLQDGDWPFDLHDKNMMMRGNVPVIIDPIYDPNGMNESITEKQLNELTGFKQNALYTGVKSAFFNKDRGYHKRLQNIATFTDFMEKHGFTKLGGGVFGVTFEKPGYPWVFKVFNDDPAYFIFLKYALQHQSNPNIPKIKGKMLRISKTIYAVRMEKLTHYVERGSSYSDIDKLARILRYIQYASNITKDNKEWLQENYPGIYQILMDLDTSSGFNFDIHGSNFMMRGNTPVITDPLVDPAAMMESNTSDYVINELTGYRKHPAYAAAIDIFQPTHGWSYRSRKLTDFTNKLKSLGYDIDVKGLGRAGTVFKRLNDPYVIKIFHDDPDYMKYIKYVMDHQNNPHVPKVRGKLLKINDKTYAIRTEELQPYVAVDGNEEDLLRSINDNTTWIDLVDDTYIRLELPLLHKLFSDLAKIYGSNQSTDLIPSNIMRRNDGTIVITDPA